LRRRRDLSPVVLPALAALAAAALLLWANFRALHGRVVTSDDGVWPGSWKRSCGWPWQVYGSFGYDPGSGGVCWWCPDGLALNLAIGLSIMAGAALLARMLAPSRP
jgi:hypothetical protein